MKVDIKLSENYINDNLNSELAKKDYQYIADSCIAQLIKHKKHLSGYEAFGMISEFDFGGRKIDLPILVEKQSKNKWLVGFITQSEFERCKKECDAHHLIDRLF